MQALLFGSTTPIGTYSGLSSTFGDTTLGLLGSGWRVPDDQLAFDQVFALAGAIVVAVLVWRGLPFALYFVVVEFVSFGPLALFFLLLFPLPTVPPALIAIPVLILSISVIRDMR